MSMLSAQCDRLRKMADWDGIGAVIAYELRDAADTIWQLRDDLQRANAENAKLRETCLDAHEWMSRALYDGSARRHEYESITERMRELGVEVTT